MLAGVNLDLIPTRGAPLPLPNASFESPTTSFVSVLLDDWEKSPKPDWYEEAGGFLWEQLTGLFKNTPLGAADHIENCDGAQAAWLFAVPEVGLFLDPATGAAPAFEARYETGRSYQLTVGVIGMGGNMQEGVPLEISFYYRTDAGSRVTIAATTITNSPALFPTRTRFVDVSLQLPEVEPGDAWAGRHIGIALRSTVDFERQGGFWDLDHVRLASYGAPSLVGPAWKDGQFEATIQGEPGTSVAVLASDDVSRPVAAWVLVGTYTNETGTVHFTDPEAGTAGRCYQARVVAPP